jgi:hypothetical protein
MAGIVDNRLGVLGASITKEQYRARALRHGRRALAAAQRLGELQASLAQFFHESSLSEPVAPPAEVPSAQEEHQGFGFSPGVSSQE